MQEKKSCSKRHFRNRRIFVRLGPVPYKGCGTERGSSQEKNELRQIHSKLILQIIRLTGSTQRTPRMADDAPAGDGAGACDNTMHP
jgi:hypothetical protein